MCLWKILYSFEILVTTEILLLSRRNVSLKVLASNNFEKFLHSLHVSAATDPNEF